MFPPRPPRPHGSWRARLGSIGIGLCLVGCSDGCRGRDSSSALLGPTTAEERIADRAGGCPALVASEGELFAVFRGSRSDDAVLWTHLDGSIWAPEEVLGPGVFTSASPALAALGRRPYAAWKGAGDNRSIWYSHLDGAFWSGLRVVPGPVTDAAPALAAYDARLYVMWKGAGTAELWWSFYDGASWVPPRLMEGVATSAAPALAADEDRLYAAWKGLDGDPAIWWSSYDGTSWAPQRPFVGSATDVGPALAAGEGNVYVAWKMAPGDAATHGASAEGSDVVAGDGIGWSSMDGEDFAPPRQLLAHATRNKPGLAVFDHALHFAWTVDASRQVHLARIDLRGGTLPAH